MPLHLRLKIYRISSIFAIPGRKLLTYCATPQRRAILRFCLKKPIALHGFSIGQRLSLSISTQSNSSRTKATQPRACRYSSWYEYPRVAATPAEP